MTFEELIEIVETNEKKRFDLDRNTGRIRANQGHSIDIELGLASSIPPAVLFHGTAIQNRESITSSGLLRGARHHVHLSSDISTARAVGSRHGTPFVFKVETGRMHQDGFLFFRSKNDVWLTLAVPPAYLSETGAAD